MAHDYNFLKESLKHTIKVDEFTGRLWEIYETIRSEGGPLQVGTTDLLFKISPGKPKS